jgi:hypothetical protein
MSDLLVRPDAAEQENAPLAPDTPDAPEAAGSTEASGASAAGVTPIRTLLAALLLGAGAIHVAMAPSHLGESAVEGTGFLAAAWAQFGLAAAIALSRRPSRRVLAAAAATSVALIAVWAWSRTAGLPFGAHDGHAESVSVVDGACVALEVLAAVVAGVLLTRLGTLAIGGRLKGLALVAAVAALGLATGVIASPAARDHASASHGTHGTEMGGGHDHGAAAGAEGDDLGFAELSNGHQHEHTTDEPLTARERVTLARQIAATAELVERYPTVAHAEAAGWTRAGPFSPGLGTHYMSPNIARDATGVDAGTMDPDNMPTPMLVFDGLDADAPLAGFMYQAYGGGEPEGFAGPNDHWHYHESVCIKTEGGVLTTPFGADLEGVTERMCTDVGGQWIETTGYMVHVWSVPGYESPDGMFTELNPRITCPDGTYHRIDIAETGNRDSVCRNP